MIKNLFFLFLTIFFSCSGDECVNDVVGTYNGSCTSTSGTLSGSMNIFESPEGGSKVFIEEGISFISGFMGDLSGNCKTISIGSQSVTDINGASVTISGTLHVNGSSLTGELTFDRGSTESVCAYNLVKG
jgi:hypothetical protein